MYDIFSSSCWVWDFSEYLMTQPATPVLVVTKMISNNVQALYQPPCPLYCTFRANIQKIQILVKSNEENRLSPRYVT